MSSSVMQLVDRKVILLDIQKEADHMAQSTEDFFTLADRKELMKQGLQMEQILKDLGDLKVAGAVSTESHERRIRALEDERLKLRTQIGVISTLAAGGVSLLMKILWK